MALTLAGYPTSRRDGLELFGARYGWVGASHASITAAVLRRTGHLYRWRHCPNTEAQYVLTWLYRAAVNLRGRPAVVTAYCRHRILDLLCGHAFVLVGCSDERIRLLDPLGKRPTVVPDGNVLVSVSQFAAEALIVAEGAVWDLCGGRPISILKL